MQVKTKLPDVNHTNKQMPTHYVMPTKHIRIIVLAHSTHSHQCLHVLVRLHRVHEVKRSWIRGFAITGSEVYSHSEVDLTTSKDVVQKGVCSSRLHA